MATKRPQKTSKARKAPPKRWKTKVEWAAGTGPVPGRFQERGETFHPHVLVWMNADGLALGISILRPGGWTEAIAASFEETVAQPHSGPAHRPDRVRVATPLLCDLVQRALPDVEVIEAETPEVEIFLLGMEQHFAELDEASDKLDDSYLEGDQTPAGVAAFFRAAAGLFRKAPWAIVPNDHCLVSVTIEALDLRDAIVTTVGQRGESHGLVVFSSLDDYERYASGAELLEKGGVPRIPAHWALNFDRGAELDPSVRKEIVQHRWEVASAEAYPWIAIVGEGMVRRLPTAADTRRAEAIMLGVTKLLDEKRGDLLLAWGGGEEMERSFTLETQAGPVEARFCVPPEGAVARLGRLFEPLHELCELELKGDMADEARRDSELVIERRFLASEAGGAFPAMRVSRKITSLAAERFDVTLATLDPEELEEIVFGLLPNELNLSPEEAGLVIEEARAFITFLGEELGMPQAKPCLKKLGARAVAKLESSIEPKRRRKSR